MTGRMEAAIPQDGRHARSHSTRESILIAAEQLFAELGISNVSLRDISVAAGQKNNGAVQYHFGDRENLLRQIVAYRAKFTEEVRLALLEEIVSKKGQPQVRDYVSAFVQSMASVLNDENYFLRFFSRLVMENGGRRYTPVPASTVDLMKTTMLTLMPHMSERVLHQRWQIMTATTVHMLAAYQAAQKTGRLSAPLNVLIDDLIMFLTAGLQAPIIPSEHDGQSSPSPNDAETPHFEIDGQLNPYRNKKSDLKHDERDSLARGSDAA